MVDEIARVNEISLLYDFYAPLLTEKQRGVLELYYEDDLSLGEIAEIYGITRQAVHDILKRAEKILEGYEEKLGLVTRFKEQRDALERAYHLLRELAVDFNRQKAQEIIAILEKVLEIEVMS